MVNQSLPTLYGIQNCDTVKKARAWLDDRGIVYAFHDYKKSGVSAEKLAGWCQTSTWQAILNRAGTTFRKLAETDRADLNEVTAIALMIAQPSMIKRPIVEHGGQLWVGFDIDAWDRSFTVR
jgi:arsenate reductase (glutaredoxin)